MKTNKKFNIFVTLAIALNIINFSLCNQSAVSEVNYSKKSPEIYLPKFYIKLPEITSDKKTPEIKNKKNPTSPVIKEKIKTVQETKPQIKAKMPPVIKPNKISIIKPNTALSLSHFIKNINAPYSKTFISVLSALSDSKVEILSFNSLDGKIYARLNNNKNLYILIHSVNTKITSIRITPADGIYNIPDTVVDSIFEKIDSSNLSNTDKRI